MPRPYDRRVADLASIRDAVWNRCRGYCEKCGKGLPYDGWALHHRKLRSQGGKDEISNFLALHHKCHNLGTNSVHLNPTEAIEKGYIVPSWAEPLESLVMLRDGSSVILNEEGTYTIMKAGKNGW